VQFSDQEVTAQTIVDMFVLRLDELTIALHEHAGINIETSSDSTARPTSPPAHRHTALIAITSPRTPPGHNIARTVTAYHQHIATHGESTKPPAHCHTRRQHSDSTAAVAIFPSIEGGVDLRPPPHHQNIATDNTVASGGNLLVDIIVDISAAFIPLSATIVFVSGFLIQQRFTHSGKKQ